MESNIVTSVELTPAKRREYYCRALSLFSMEETRKYSCSELARMVFQENTSLSFTDTFEMFVMQAFPEYFAVLTDLKRATIGRWGRALIQVWPKNAEGNKARCDALSEAIKRVDLLLNIQPC